MTPRQISLVQESFAAVRADGDAAAALFYAKLFEQQPRLRSLFADDMTQQRQLLMTMIGAAVARLDRVDELLPALHDLGRRHTGYGVRDEDYAPVGAALLATLAEAFGPAFSDELRDAWATAYGILSGAMKAGAGGSAEHRSFAA
jgi:hemoglobin-like flavoprotein